METESQALFQRIFEGDEKEVEKNLRLERVVHHMNGTKCGSDVVEGAVSLLRFKRLPEPPKQLHICK